MIFKIFETIGALEDYYDLQIKKSKKKPINEADEQDDFSEDSTSDNEETEEVENELTETQPEQEEPEENADVDAGIFISDIQKADIAKAMINALMLTPPESGTIPANLLNVTTSNSDDVMKYVQSLVSLQNNLSEESDDGMVETLKNV